MYAVTPVTAPIKLKTKMKQSHLLLLLLIALLASCSSDSFKIEGNIANLEGGAVKVVFRGDSGVVDQLVNLDKKGRFTFEGTSAQPVIVNLLNRNNEPLAAVVAANGDHIKVKGDASKAMSVKVKGNKINEEWQLFRDEHASFYTDPNPSRLDAAIEKYVREHPGDLLSTVLLVTDYSDYGDRGKIEKMLKGIEAEARPESLTQVFPSDLKSRVGNNLPRLMTLTLVKHGGNFEEIKLTDRVSLICLWANPQQERNTLIDKLQGLDNKVRVIDVLAESDTLHWHQTIAADPEGWLHYWAPGGPLEQGIQLLGITSMPWYAVTDSTGMVTYSGPDLTAATRATTH